MLVFVAACIVAFALWVAALRKRAELAIGIAVGLALAALVSATAPSFKTHEIPVWLPPLPFAVIACTLFFFGGLAWWWGSDDR
jgi:hypothetical protein